MNLLEEEFVENPVFIYPDRIHISTGIRSQAFEIITAWISTQRPDRRRHWEGTPPPERTGIVHKGDSFSIGGEYRLALGFSRIAEHLDGCPAIKMDLENSPTQSVSPRGEQDPLTVGGPPPKTVTTIEMCKPLQISGLQIEDADIPIACSVGRERNLGRIG